MVKKVSLDIPDNIYEEIASLCAFYKQDTKETIVSILDVVSREIHSLERLSKEYKAPVKLEWVLADMLNAGSHTIGLFNEILEKLEVKDLYALEDFELNPDEDYIYFAYAALEGNNLQVTSFALWMNGLTTLRTESVIVTEKVNKQSLDKLKEVVKDDLIAPGTFRYLEDYTIDIDYEDDELWNLIIECTAVSIDHLPSIKQVSRFVKQILKKAGIQQKK
jgi:hypothetical protein